MINFSDLFNSIMAVCFPSRWATKEALSRALRQLQRRLKRFFSDAAELNNPVRLSGSDDTASSLTATMPDGHYQSLPTVRICQIANYTVRIVKKKIAATFAFSPLSISFSLSHSLRFSGHCSTLFETNSLTVFKTFHLWMFMIFFNVYSCITGFRLSIHIESLFLGLFTFFGAPSTSLSWNIARERLFC